MIQNSGFRIQESVKNLENQAERLPPCGMVGKNVAIVAGKQHNRNEITR